MAMHNIDHYNIHDYDHGHEHGYEHGFGHEHGYMDHGAAERAYYYGHNLEEDSSNFTPPPIYHAFAKRAAAIEK